MYRLFIVCIGCLVFSCENSNHNNALESFGENKSEGSVANCLCTDLIANEKGLLLKNNEPYTGNCYLNYENSDNKYIEKQIVNGLINGKIIYYSKDGTVIFEEKYNNGAHQLDLDIENIYCNCLELTENKSDGKFYYNDQVFKGVCFNLFPGTEQPYIEITYNKGQREGYTTYYNKLGEILYTEKYEANNLIKTIYPKK